MSHVSGGSSGRGMRSADDPTRDLMMHDVKGSSGLARSSYAGPSVFGYETDRPLRRVAGISVHTSPLATLGGADAGGMNVYVRELACHLAGLGLPIDLFTRRTDPSTPEVSQPCANVNVISIAAGPAEPLPKNELFPLLPEFAEQMALYSLRQGVRYDVVHAHYWLSGWVAHLLKRYWDAPFIQMFHTTAHMKNAVSSPAHRESPLRLSIERRLIALADSVIAANPDERADLIWRHGASGSKVCTVPPGVDTELFSPGDQRAARQTLDLDAHHRIVLFVGRIDPIKGIDTLIDAVEQMNGEPHRDLTVLFVGGERNADGRAIGDLAVVENDVQDRNLSRRFRFVGSVPRSDLPAYYRAADVVAIPSRYESFGLVAVEAMACGVPVVASRVGGLTFTVEEDQTGILVPKGSAAALAEALTFLLDNPTARERMGAASRLSAERFSWPVVARTMNGVYQRLAAGHRVDLCCDEDLFA